MMKDRHQEVIMITLPQISWRKSSLLIGSAVLSASIAAAAAPAVVTPGTPQNPLAQAITDAPDPSSAIQAYAKATAGAPASVEVEQAYLHRMVSFGLPEMAD